MPACTKCHRVPALKSAADGACWNCTADPAIAAKRAEARARGGARRTREAPPPVQAAPESALDLDLGGITTSAQVAAASIRVAQLLADGKISSGRAKGLLDALDRVAEHVREAEQRRDLEVCPGPEWRELTEDELAHVARWGAAPPGTEVLFPRGSMWISGTPSVELPVPEPDLSHADRIARELGEGGRRRQ